MLPEREGQKERKKTKWRDNNKWLSLTVWMFILTHFCALACYCITANKCNSRVWVNRSGVEKRGEGRRRRRAEGRSAAAVMWDSLSASDVSQNMVVFTHRTSRRARRSGSNVWWFHRKRDRRWAQKTQRLVAANDHRSIVFIKEAFIDLFTIKVTCWALHTGHEACFKMCSRGD